MARRAQELPGVRVFHARCGVNPAPGLGLEESVNIANSIAVLALKVRRLERIRTHMRHPDGLYRCEESRRRPRLPLPPCRYTDGGDAVDMMCSCSYCTGIMAAKEHLNPLLASARRRLRVVLDRTLEVPK